MKMKKKIKMKIDMERTGPQEEKDGKRAEQTRYIPMMNDICGDDTCGEDNDVGG